MGTNVSVERTVRVMAPSETVGGGSELEDMGGSE